MHRESIPRAVLRRLNRIDLLSCRRNGFGHYRSCQSKFGFQPVDQLLDGENFFDPVGVFTGKSKSVLQFTLAGVAQGYSDAIRAFLHIAGLDAVERAFENFPSTLVHLIEKGISDRPARQAEDANAYA